MNFKKLLPLSALAIFLTAQAAVHHTQPGNDNALYDTTTKAQLISNQFSFTEGPATDKKGNIFFTDQPNNKIWNIRYGGKLSLFIEHAGRANGTYFDHKGNLIVCADEHNQLWRIAPDGKVKILVK
jgi:gluconolactonase